MTTVKRSPTRPGSPRLDDSVEKLLQCAEALHSSLDSAQIASTLAGRVLDLVSAPLVALLFRQPEGLRLKAIAADDPQLEEQFRTVYSEGKCSALDQLAHRAMSGSAHATASVEIAAALQEALPAGQVLAVGLRTSRQAGALLVFAGAENTFSEQERSLVAAVANFGAIAIANAELYSTASSQACELQQLLEISSELGTISKLDHFLEKFVVRAAEFLGFRRAYIALKDGDTCDIRWCATEGRAQPMKMALKTHISEQVLSSKQPYWTDDATAEPEAEFGATGRRARQFLAVPLLGADSRVLGILGVLDRESESGVGAEDVRRAKALAAEAAVALEATHALHLSEQHRKRAENLMSMALELGSSLRLPDFARNFTTRATDMMGARAGALALAQGLQLETVILHDPGPSSDRALMRQLNVAFSDFVATGSHQPVVAGTAAELLGPGLASALSWSDVTLARLTGSEGELIGVLCLADRHVPLNEEDSNVLQALGGHATVALENSRLFSRITQASHQWAEIFDAITDFIVVHDEANKVLRVNRSLAEFIGVPPAQLIGVTMRALVAIGGESAAQACPFCRAGMDLSDEYIHPVLERTYLVSTSRIHGALNEGLQTIHVLKDITDRREAERRYRELFDNVQEGIFFSSPEGRFIEVNDALVRMLGYGSREELLQVDIPSQIYLSPEKRLEFRKSLEKTGVLRNYEEALKRKDGSLIHTLQNAFAVRDAQGRVVQYRGVVLDVTEQKEFQAQLQRERDFNSKILNNTQSMILVVDTAGLVSYGNRRCLETGAYKAERLLGHRLIDFVPGGRKAALTEAFEATLRGEQVDNLEIPLLRGDGRVGQFSINLSPMRDEQGNINSIVVVMTDITDASMLQAKLMHAEKMAAVGQLVSGVAHEVNNPLTAILGFADLLIDNRDVPESVRRDLMVILQEAQRTKVIVQNLLSFARQSAPQREPVQLNQILRRTVQLRSYDFSSHGVEVIEKLNDSLPEVVGDSQQLQQVFLNILNNAYDAVRETARRGHIEITSSFADDSVYVSFCDNGPGIANADRIFDPFFTTKEVGKGTGLGLSICYGILREHGGEITCHNNGNGEGATFIVKLPAASKAIAAAIAAGAQA